MTDQDRDPDPPREPGDARRLLGPLGVGRTVLIAEDIEEHRYLYVHVLRHAGYRVLEASDGERAVALAREQRPDAIVLDLGLPIIDGFQVMHLLKSNPATRSIPIIAVTVHASATDVARTSEFGCELHMAKPALPMEVLEAVHRALGLLSKVEDDAAI
ncbi:MAG TPA: response regulator [Gemmatimonadaceae bacterium]|nr:response regulator [Gemmatimonadaceae bacterium]